MFEKQERLMKIAQSDPSYLLWNKTYEDAKAQFEAYANAQPQEIQDILWGYAAGGRMMNQRLLNLACEHMDFLDRESPKKRRE